MPLRLVVKSGSNRRAKTSGGIPDPVSVTVISAYARPARVGDEVGDHLFDLAEIDHGAKLIRRDVGVDCDKLAGEGAQFGDVAVQPGSEIDDRDVRRNRSGETRDFLRHALAALHGYEDLVGDALRATPVGRLAQRRQCGLDRHQDVVHFVRDRTGDSAEAVHTPRTLQLRLDMPLLHSLLPVLQRALDRRNETAETVLQYIVARAEFQYLDRFFVAQRSGDDDERQVGLDLRAMRNAVRPSNNSLTPRSN